MYCYMKGIVAGRPGKLFDPRGQATRAEVAAMLRRFAESAATDDGAAADGSSPD
jgi:hypothetical protein